MECGDEPIGKRTGGKRSFESSTKDGNHKSAALSSNVTSAGQNRGVLPLTNPDPLAITTIFQSSKTKNFLYREEPDIPRLTGSSLDLISTTGALVLRSMVERAVALREQETVGSKTTELWLTSTHLKQVVEESSSLEFLEETYQNFKDKDASIPQRKWQEYAPSKRPRKKTKTSDKKESKSNLGSKENEGKTKDAHSKSIHALGALTRSTVMTTGDTDAPLEKAIRDAATNPTSQQNDGSTEIVEDDEDYD